jgi:polyketide cyclase/dehydrase/lipid transport protein
MTTFTIIRKLDFPVDKVWKTAGDFKKAPGSNIIVTVEDQGDHSANDVGAIRTIKIGNVQVRERLESMNAPKSFSYKVLTGAPMKNHLAKVEFISQGKSTEIRWSVEFTPKIPGIGWIVGSVTKKAINRFIDEVEMALR